MNRRARTRLQEQREREGNIVELASGKRLLSSLSKWTSDLVGVSFGVGAILHALRVEDIPEEVGKVLTAIETVGPLARMAFNPKRQRCGEAACKLRFSAAHSHRRGHGVLSPGCARGPEPRLHRVRYSVTIRASSAPAESRMEGMWRSWHRNCRRIATARGSVPASRHGRVLHSTAGNRPTAIPKGHGPARSRSPHHPFAWRRARIRSRSALDAF